MLKSPGSCIRIIAKKYLKEQVYIIKQTKRNDAPMHLERLKITGWKKFGGKDLLPLFLFIPPVHDPPSWARFYPGSSLEPVVCSLLIKAAKRARQKLTEELAEITRVKTYLHGLPNGRT